MNLKQFERNRENWVAKARELTPFAPVLDRQVGKTTYILLEAIVGQEDHLILFANSSMRNHAFRMMQSFLKTLEIPHENHNYRSIKIRRPLPTPSYYRITLSCDKSDLYRVKNSYTRDE